MIDYSEQTPVYGIINDNCSRLYPGAKVQVLAYLETTKQYRVKNVDSEYTCDVYEDGIDLIKE